MVVRILKTAGVVSLATAAARHFAPSLGDRITVALADLLSDHDPLFQN